MNTHSRKQFDKQTVLGKEVRAGRGTLGLMLVIFGRVRKFKVDAPNQGDVVSQFNQRVL